jgi:ribulose-phosphate 3-epimerase
MNLVVPAVLPASKSDLEEKLKLYSSIPAVAHVQIDVVDGVFAAPACWPYNSPGELEAMAKRRETLPYLGQITYEIDLMCSDAERAVKDWIALGATRFTFHAESESDFGALLAGAHRRYSSGADFGSELIAFGAALSVGSDLALIEPHLDKVQYVQFMGIARIGRQGEPLDERVYEKIRVFRERHPEMPLQVDGGVSLTSAQKLVALGVSRLIVGSALLTASDPIATFKALEDLETPFGV